MTTLSCGLPDPELDAEFYDDVPVKRLLAWIVDVVLIALMSLLLLPFTLFTALFAFPVFFAGVGFCYRWLCLARGSATLGMRFMAIEFRDAAGRRFDAATAFWHTTGYLISVTVFPLQLISAALMVGTPRGQGLTDLVLGSSAVNRSVR